MLRTVIDTDVIKIAIHDLKKLKSEYNTERSANKKPKSDEDQGKVEGVLEDVCQLLNQEWNLLFELIDKSIAFLSDTSASHEESDKKSASALH